MEKVQQFAKIQYFSKMQAEKRGKEWNIFLNFLYYHYHCAATAPFVCSRSVLSFYSLEKEIKTSTLEVLVIHFLQFNL